MKLCHSDFQKLEEKPLPSAANVPKQFISHAVRNVQCTCSLPVPSSARCRMPSHGRVQPLVLPDALGQGSLHPGVTDPWDCHGKGAASAARDDFPWEGRLSEGWDSPATSLQGHCGQFPTATCLWVCPPHHQKEQPAPSPPLKSRRLLAESISLHEKVATCPIRHLDSQQLLLHYLLFLHPCLTPVSRA